jgi:hypothetical protein
MEKNSNMSIYDKYLNSIKENDNMGHRVNSLSMETQFMKVAMQSLKVEKKNLEGKLMSMQKDPQLSKEAISLLEQNKVK